MFIAVRGFLTEFLNSTTATSRFPALTAKLAALIILINNIKTQAATQRMPLKARIQARDTSFQAAITKAVGIAGFLRSHARDHRLADLEVQAAVTPSTFRSLRKAHRMELAQKIHDLAAPLQTQLAEIGLTATMLAELQAAITTADETVIDRADLSEEKKVATDQLAKLFQSVDRLLDVLDPMFQHMAETDNETYTRYLAARNVINRPGAQRENEAGDESPAATTATAAHVTGATTTSSAGAERTAA
jgi:hypothetical protein